MIYIHIPYCRSFCTYCDFYSEIADECCGKAEKKGTRPGYEEFAEALTKEIDLRKGEISKEVNTLYIGGGTPSVLPLFVFTKIVNKLREVGYAGPYDEFTVEVNPDDIVEKGSSYVEGLLALGVNRISMGVQSFDDSILRFMNRRHDSAAVKKAYGILEDTGIGNISVDLIFGLPQLSDRQWVDTIDKALGLSSKGTLPQHISSYQLSVEPGSALARMVERGLWSEASEDLCARQYGMLCESLAKAGYNHYEISNFAQPGYEAMHNGAYWHHVPYAGFGPGAHSFVVNSKEAVRKWNLPDLNGYVSDLERVQEHEDLTDEQLVLERVMLGLRTSEGISESYLREHCAPHELSNAIASGNLVPIIKDSQSPQNVSNLRIPEEKFFVSDTIIASLL